MIWESKNPNYKKIVYNPNNNSPTKGTSSSVASGWLGSVGWDLAGWNGGSDWGSFKGSLKGSFRDIGRFEGYTRLYLLLQNLEVLLVGVLVMRALLLGVDNGAPEFLETPIQSGVVFWVVPVNVGLFGNRAQSYGLLVLGYWGAVACWAGMRCFLVLLLLA